MPRIPDYLAQREVPGTGGLPRGTVNIPVTGEPQADAQGFTATERGLQTLGAGVEHLGTNLIRAQEVEATRRRADGVLKAKLQAQEYRLKAQPLYDELRQGDYETFPERLLESGRELMGELAQDLTPEAQGLFQEDASQFLGALQQRALTERTQRRDQQTAFALTREIKDYQQHLLLARDPFERALAEEMLDSTVERFVATGLVNGAQAATLLQKTREETAVQTVQVAIQAQPVAMRAQLLAQGAGQPTREDLPLAPPSQLAQLTAQAGEVSRQQANDRFRDEQRAGVEVQKRQEQREADLYRQLTELDPVPENVAQYDALLRMVNQEGVSGGIRGEGQRVLGGLVLNLRRAAANPRETDDRAAERTLTLQLYAANNDRDFAQVKEDIFRQADLLTRETRKGLLSTLDERSQRNHWSRLPGVQAGRQIILGGDITEGGQAVFRGLRQEAEQVRLRIALDAYTTQIQDMASTNAQEANYRAPEIALQIRRTYMDVPSREETLRRLPLPLQGPDGQGIPQKEEAYQIIRQLPFQTDAERQRIREQYDRWQQLEQQLATPPAAPTAPRQPAGGRQQVPIGR